MSFLITRPQHMNFRDWSDQIREDIGGFFGTFAKADGHEEQWQQWAENLIGLQAISRYNPPDPHFYSDWREWAEHLVRSLE